MITNESKNVLLATIVASKGLKGEVKLKSFTEDPLAIMDYNIFDAEGNIYKVTNAYIHKNIVVAKLEGINSITDAENLVNKSFYTNRDSFKELEEDSYYHIDLIDINVLSLNDEHLGKVIAVYDFGAGDVLEIMKDNNEKILIRFTKQNILEVNLQKKYLKIADIQYIDFENNE